MTRLGEVARKFVKGVPHLALARTLRDAYLLALFVVSLAGVVTYNYRPHIYMKS